MQVQRAQSSDLDVIEYLEKDLARNALDIWYLKHGDKRHELHVCRINGAVKAHLGLYNTPEGIYTNLGGESGEAEALLSLVPNKAVLTTTKTLGELVARKRKSDVVYPNDLLAVERGEERLRNPEQARRLSIKDDTEYSKFGSSFNVPVVPIEWIRECLERDIVFGVFADGKLASVASVAVWLPQIAMIMSVETRPEFRRKGLGAIVVSAAVREALARSEACSLFVRSDNEQAKALYGGLGFRKIGEELWIDFGTGMIP